MFDSDAWDGAAVELGHTVWTYRTGPVRRLGGPATGKSIVEEVRRIIPLARHLL